MSEGIDVTAAELERLRAPVDGQLAAGDDTTEAARLGAVDLDRLSAPHHTGQCRPPLAVRDLRLGGVWTCSCGRRRMLNDAGELVLMDAEPVMSGVP